VNQGQQKMLTIGVLGLIIFILAFYFINLLFTPQDIIVGDTTITTSPINVLLGSTGVVCFAIIIMILRKNKII
jgi:hypothetical protein